MVASSDAPLRTRAGALALPVLVAAGIAVLCVLAHRRMAASARYVVDPRQLALLEHPAWMSEALARRVGAEMAAALGGPTTLLGDRALAGWRARLAAASPWIAGVELVRPRFPAQADVRVAVERPVLRLGDDVLVAGDGRVLGPGRVHLEPPLVRYSGAMDERALRECAAAAAELRPWMRELQAAGVLVVAVARDWEGLVVFETDRGVELDWGRARASVAAAGFDLPAEAKIENLHEVLARYPGLSRVRRVRLWLDRPEVVPGA